jgi:hypothetical protein
MRGNKKERKGKREKLNWEFTNLNNYGEENKRVFHEIGLKEFIRKERSRV